MATAPLPTRFAGVTCPACGYDVRGLPRTRCPECGGGFDPHAPAAARPHAILGWTASAVAVCAAVWIAWWSADTSLLYLRELGGWCGTVRMWAWSSLTSSIPLSLIVPAAAYGVSRWAGRGAALARVALIAAVASWLLCYLTIRFAV